MVRFAMQKSQERPTGEKNLMEAHNNNNSSILVSVMLTVHCSRDTVCQAQFNDLPFYQTNSRREREWINIVSSSTRLHVFNRIIIVMHHIYIHRIGECVECMQCMSTQRHLLYSPKCDKSE